MNFTTDACVITVWSTKFAFAHGEISINGVRVPGPQRPFTTPPFTPAGCLEVVLSHLPIPVSWSAPWNTGLDGLLLAVIFSEVSNDEFWIVGAAWSYQP